MIMSGNLNEQEAYTKAKRRVDEIKAFYVHLMIFLVTSTITLIIGWILSYELFIVFIVGLLGWAIGVGVHGINVYGLNLFLGKDWEDRKLKEIKDKQNQENHA